MQFIRLLRHKEQALALNILGKYGLESRDFALLTLHRPSNVDAPEVLAGILDVLEVMRSRVRSIDDGKRDRPGSVG